MSTEIDSMRNYCAMTETIGLPQRSNSEEQTDGVTAGGDQSATVVSRLLTASHRLRSVLADHYAQFGLSDVRHAVLQILRDAAPDGCSQSQLAERLAQSESSVCMLVKRMRDAELLYRLRSRFDRRNWVLNLTERGLSLLNRVEECHGSRMREMLDGFAPEDLNSLSTLLQRFSDELEHVDLSTAEEPVSAIPHHSGGVDVARVISAEDSAGDVKLPPAA